jgi:hypothetical protein
MRMVNATSMTQSGFSFAQQVGANTGQRWEAEITLPPMFDDDAEEWLAWLASMRGHLGTFTMGDPMRARPRGLAPQYTLNDYFDVNGAGQTGSTLNIDGIRPSSEFVFMAGDYVQIGSGATARLHKVLQRVDSNGSGEATLDLWPNIRTAPADNDPVTFINPVGLWRLATNSIDWTINEASQYGLTFPAIGVVT